MIYYYNVYITVKIQIVLFFKSTQSNSTTSESIASLKS